MFVQFGAPYSHARLALLFNPPQVLIQSITSINAISIFAVAYLAYGSTLFGYGIWSNLVTSYPLSKVAPLSLLVPVTGLLTARLVLAEQLSGMQWLGVSIILLGLVVTNVDMRQIVEGLKEKKSEKKEHAKDH